MRILWCTLLLNWRNLGSAFSKRDANRMARTHSGLAKPGFRIPRTRCEPYGEHSFWVCEGFAFPERDANPMVNTHSGFAKPRACIPKTKCERCVKHSSLGWRKLGFAFPKRNAAPPANLRQAGLGAGRCRHATRGLGVRREAVDAKWPPPRPPGADSPRRAPPRPAAPSWLRAQWRHAPATQAAPDRPRTSPPSPQPPALPILPPHLGAQPP